MEEETFEKLADIEHQRWADWQKWCHEVLRKECPSPELEKVLKRWDRQINTPYSELTEKEKDSDRRQVRRYWKIVKQQNAIAIKQALEQQRKEIKNTLRPRVDKLLSALKVK